VLPPSGRAIVVLTLLSRPCARSLILWRPRLLLAVGGERSELGSAKLSRVRETDLHVGLDSIGKSSAVIGLDDVALLAAPA
jgi:hypothetical protein